MKYFAQQSEDIVQKINEMDEVDSDKPPLNYLARFI